MDWIQFSIFLVTMGGLFLLNRSESNADKRDMHAILRAIQFDEIKDYGRFCALEEKNKGKKYVSTHWILCHNVVVIRFCNVPSINFVGYNK